jgi:hypothetical protein
VKNRATVTMTMTRKRTHHQAITFLRRLVLPCLVAVVVHTTPSLSLFTLAFKSTSIKQPFISSGGSGSDSGGGSGNYFAVGTHHRRRTPNATNNSRTAASSRLPISIIHHRDSACIVLHAAAAAGGGADEIDNDSASSSSIKISLDDVIDDNIGRRFSAAPSERAEILILNNYDYDELDGTTTTNAATTTTATTTTTANPTSSSTKAATSTVNERLLSEIQASLDKQKGTTTTSNTHSKTKEYLKEFRYTTKTEEERQRSLEEARDLNGVNPLVCIGGAAFAWGCAGALWVLTTYLGVFFASHPLDTDVYFVQRVAGVFRNVVVGLSSLASGFFGVVGVGIFLLGVRVGYGVITGELDPTPIKVPNTNKRMNDEEFVLPDVWELMMGKKNRRR